MIVEMDIDVFAASEKDAAVELCGVAERKAYP